MGYMFHRCTNLKSLDLSNFDTSQVHSMFEMFRRCSSLEFLDISNFNINRAIEIPGFDEINPLKYLNIYNAQIDRIKDKIKGIIQNSTIVCQKDDFEIDSKITYIKRCCYFNFIFNSINLSVIYIKIF